jgi:hypothetical protein
MGLERRSHKNISVVGGRKIKECNGSVSIMRGSNNVVLVLRLAKENLPCFLRLTHANYLFNNGYFLYYYLPLFDLAVCSFKRSAPRYLKSF